MNKPHILKPKIPLTEKLKTISDVFGIRLNEQPDYEVLVTEGDIEVRRYKKTLIAQVTIEGEHDQAVMSGFQTLANYIFGDNENQTSMEMTAPVFQESVLRNRTTGELIPMTAPLFKYQNKNGWTISFVIPEKFDRHSAPEPIDSNIHLTELPERKTAVFRYSGNNNEEKMKEAEEKLNEWLRSSGLTTKSTIRWAQYDPPFAIPFLKRNEAQIDIN